MLKYASLGILHWNFTLITSNIHHQTKAINLKGCKFGLSKMSNQVKTKEIKRNYGEIEFFTKAQSWHKHYICVLE